MGWSDLAALTRLSEHDVAGSWLDVLFTSVPLQHAFAAFNGALLLLACALLAWSVLAGLVASAREGKPLGEKAHIIWAPIRIVLAIGLLTPIPPTYLGAGQWAVYEIARVGSGLGNEIWERFSGAVLADGYSIVPPSRIGGPLVRDFVIAETCEAAMQWVDEASGESSPEPPAVEGYEALRGTTWRYRTGCGLVRLPPVEGQPKFTAARREAATHIVREARGFAQDTIGALMPGGNMALNWAPEMAAQVVAAMRDLANEYEAAVGVAAAQAASQRQAAERARIVEHGSQHGWVAAGLAWRTLAETGALATDLAAARHERIDDRDSLMAMNDVRRAVDMIARYVGVGEREVDITAGDLAAVADADSDWADEAMRPLRDAMERMETGDGEHADPVARLMSWGHGLLVAGEATAFVALPAAGVIAKNLAGSTAGLGGAFDGLAPSVRWLAWGAMGAGVLLSLILPLMPWLLVTMAAIGFIIAVVEAMIAVPAWCVALITMDGDDLLSRRAIPGAQLLVGLFMRPALTVLALGASLLLIPAVLGWADQSLAPAALGSQGGRMVGLVLSIGVVAAGVYVAWKITAQILGLVTSMPDRILTWFGVQDRRSDESNLLAVVAGMGDGSQRTASAANAATGKLKGDPRGPGNGSSGSDGPGGRRGDSAPGGGSPASRRPQ